MNPTTQRRFVRVECDAEALVTLPGESHRGVCANLSVGGAFFRGSSLPAGATVSITMSLAESGPVMVVGEVRHSSPEGSGIRFTQLPPNALTSIHGYVNALALRSAH
ncbi:MAG: PilZ domain-containing protein [Deltaproteobacteria bacterium]|nr:PilZ domain-containing protein [Deltaproteobacteria bacterium]